MDYYSNFIEVDRLSDTLAATVIHKIKHNFSRHGIPNIEVSDNGPQFSCAEFAKFEKEWEFQHVTTSPKYPQSNGKVENAVKTCKNITKKAIQSKSDIYLALLDVRNTPSEKVHASLIQLLFGSRKRLN